MKKHPGHLIIFVFFFYGLSFYVKAQSNILNSIDTLSKVNEIKKIKKKNKVLTIVFPITEPAVGMGLLAGLINFVQKSDSLEKTDKVGGVAGITTNGTRVAGDGYSGYWKKDKIRYFGIAGYGNVILDYYGLGPDYPITFDQNRIFFSQEIKFRLGESNFFLSGKYNLTKISIPNNPNDVNIFSELDADDFEVWNSGLSFVSEYDNLNNSLSPTKGLKYHLSYDQYLQFLGSERDWETLKFYSHLYFPINNKWLFAFRVESNISTGSPPFYSYPYVSLRGIPTLRYQGKLSIIVETEQTYNFTSRWGFVGFTGIVTAIKSVEDFNKNNFVWNAGGGVRYLLMKDLGLKIGADAARGPEDWTYYVIIRSA